MAMKTLTNEEYNYLVYQRAVLAKLWSIATEGEDRDYDTNNFFDLVREGAEARKRMASRTPFGDGWEYGARAENEACAQAALNEKFSGETGTPEDEAYNRACDDVAAAIRSRQ